MLRPVISLKGELNECVLIAPIIKIKGVMVINGVVIVQLNVITGAVAVNSAHESPQSCSARRHFQLCNLRHATEVL